MLTAVALLAAIARADDFADQVARVTGVDTPDSQAIDKEVEDILKQLGEAQAKAESLAPGPDKGQAMAEATELEKRGLGRALAAGDLRATAANEQKCLAQSSNVSPPGGGATSGYLCGAVRNAQPGGDANDPWVVCACTRQYLLGVRDELSAIRGRAQSYVGIRRVTAEGAAEVGTLQITPSGVIAASYPWYLKPVTADEIVQLFGVDTGQNADLARPSGWDFLKLAQQAQRKLAQLHFYQQAFSEPEIAKNYFATPKDREFALLTPAKREAYAKIQDAIRTLWRLYQLDGAFQMARIEEQLTEQTRAAEGPFQLHMDDIANDIEQRQDLSDDEKTAAWQKAKAANCPQFVAGLKGEMLDAIDAARGVAQKVYAARRRLLGDAGDWKTFALKDGAGTGDQAGIPYHDEDFGKFIGEALGLDPLLYGAQNVGYGKLETGWTFFIPSHMGLSPRWTEGDLPWCGWADFFFENPQAAYWKSESAAEMEAYNQRVLAAAQAQIPEVEAVSSGVWLRFRVDVQGHESEAVVGGAASGEQP